MSYYPPLHKICTDSSIFQYSVGVVKDRVVKGYEVWVKEHKVGWDFEVGKQTHEGRHAWESCKDRREAEEKADNLWNGKVAEGYEFYVDGYLVEYAIENRIYVNRYPDIWFCTSPDYYQGKGKTLEEAMKRLVDKHPFLPRLKLAKSALDVNNV